ncbi:MAG TPA: DUF2955 domain-containing protein [Polymorphobacter sp.]|nr:DUF2955 domain-containing protein [Polymorphobacter sp.]
MSVDAAEWQRSGARVLRTAFAVAVSMWMAYWLKLPIGFIAPVLVVTALGGLLDAFSIRTALLLVVLVALVTQALTLLLTPLLGNRPAYMTIVGVALFFAYRLQAHPKLAPVVALTLPLLVMFGPLVPLSSGFAQGMAVLLMLLAACAVTGVTLAWLVFPGAARPAAAAIPTAPRSMIDSAVSAAILVLLIALTLKFDAQSALRLLMIASTVLAAVDPRAGIKTAAMTLAATAAGVVGAFFIRNFTFIVQTPLMAGLMAALIVLGVGRRLTNPATAQIASTGLVGLFVLIGGDGSVDDKKLLVFLLYTLGGIAIAIGLRHTLLWHLDRNARLAPAQRIP